jgi:glycerol-1-phosphate dehydrogenase [NAD(P)+]
LLNHPVEQLDIEACCTQWPEWKQQEATAREIFADTGLIAMVLTEMQAKYITREALRQQLVMLKERWPLLKKRLSRQLLPSSEIKRRLQSVGAPVEPEDIGISRDRLRSSFLRAYHLRRRFTILDLAMRTGCFDLWLEKVFEN